MNARCRWMWIIGPNWQIFLRGASTSVMPAPTRVAATSVWGKSGVCQMGCLRGQEWTLLNSTRTQKQKTRLIGLTPTSPGFGGSLTVLCSVTLAGSAHPPTLPTSILAIVRIGATIAGHGVTNLIFLAATKGLKR